MEQVTSILDHSLVSVTTHVSLNTYTNYIIYVLPYLFLEDYFLTKKKIKISSFLQKHLQKFTRNFFKGNINKSHI